ncbi:hypothetical protein N7471_002567 [Penicillium samsonianum]|uniref:uncharacterized protein n=1 Tax=Penicillium samsonianum TaxID=1882272 RepID=UPI0025469866|nr:uncharacterized protein N7471_002567 [Penicillium samsonianum]KAJ6143114.1 hypothetical protein N7471_002567 [Penicillium samsonianum]
MKFSVLFLVGALAAIVNAAAIAKPTEGLEKRCTAGVGGKDKQESRLMGHKNTACAMLIVIAAPEIALPTLKVVTASPHKPE